MFLKNYISHPDKKINSLLLKLFSLHPNEIDLSLKRIEKLLKKIGNPHLKIPKVIHIAGTNGKGSIATIIYELQKKFGKKVHVYRSPHLITFNERIHISNKEISNEYLKEILERIFIENKNEPITFFEITTAAAFLGFSENYADLVILEVGLGGKFDATNVIKKKTASIITPIGKDHTEYLGNTLSKISREKVGIITSNSLLISSKQKKSVNNIIRITATDKKCKSYIYGSEWLIKNNILFFDNNKIDLSQLSLTGQHQLYNAGCAIIACKKIKNLDFDKKKALAAIKSIKWLGRLHKIDGRIAKKYPGSNIWVDSAHNELGFKVIKKWVQKNCFSQLIIIVGLGIKKDYKKILLEIKEMKPAFICFINVVSFSSHSPKKLQKESSLLNINSKIFDNVFEAINYSSHSNIAKVRNNILVTGSISLLGQLIREDLKTNLP